MKPLNFKEFLSALNQEASLDIINNKIPAPDFTHDKLMKLFHTYSIIGGMPEVIQKYADQKDIIALNSVFDSLIVSYLDDVEKYARNYSMANVIRHADLSFISFILCKAAVAAEYKKISKASSS